MKQLVLLTFSLIFFTTLGAQTFTTVQSGDWNDSNTWQNGQIPNLTKNQKSTYQVNIRHTVTFDNDLVLGKLSVLDISSDATLIVDGDFEIRSNSNPAQALNLEGILEVSKFTYNSNKTTVSHSGLLITEDTYLSKGTYELTGEMDIKNLYISSSTVLNATNADISLSDKIEGSNSSQINLDNANLDAASEIKLMDSHRMELDGGSTVTTDKIILESNADIEAVGSGGILSTSEFDSQSGGAAVICGSGGTYSNTQSIPSPLNLYDCTDASALLPVTWQSVEARKNGEIVDLNWSTESESNNDYFEVERSDDQGTSWYTIGQVAGNGTTQAVSEYIYTDRIALISSTTYYRLRQVDFDGSSDYSPIVSVTTDSPIAEVTVYPNPTTDYFTVRLTPGIQIVEATLYDGLGRAFQLGETPQKASSQFTVPAGLTTGTYCLILQTNTGIIHQQLLVTR